MESVSLESITTEEFFFQAAAEKNIRLDVLRLDKIHPIISGNKWFKLKYWLEEARIRNITQLVTFGGAYSNHIVATAAAGKLLNFKTTGMIRGEEPTIFSHTLQQASEYGMKLCFINRKDFREKNFQVEEGENKLFINEGGYGEPGVRGAAEILDYCRKKDYTHICCALGTTTMMAGLLRSSLPSQHVVGIAVLKNLSLQTDLQKLLLTEDQEKPHLLIHDYHFGGYARKTAGLIDFMNDFYASTSIPTDFVYTGKLFFGVLDLVKKNFFPPASRVLIIHSGGLQGNDSLPKDMLSF